MSEIENISKVETALRSQREAWREVVARTAQYSARDLPREAPKRILFFGVGSSHFAARLCAYALLRDKTRIRIPMIGCSSQAIGKEIFPQRGDWAFAFTHRGRTPLTLQALEISRRAGAFCVLVSGQGTELPPESVMQAPDLVLHTSPLEKVDPHTVSVTSAICAVTTLLLPARAAEEWDALTSVGDPNLENLRKRVGQGPSILLGEWEGEWLAREGALKLMEIARVQARAFSSEEFFHGPDKSMGPDQGIWHIQIPEDGRTQDIARLKPQHEIGIYGGSALAWIPALVELQWAALAVALNRGVDPDGTPI